MVEKDVIPAVDQAIAALRTARKLLVASHKQGKSNPRSIGKAATSTNGTRAKRVLSEESRQRIVEAQRKRWAAVRKAAKKAAKKTP
jgi:hypothetical protein